MSEPEQPVPARDRYKLDVSGMPEVVMPLTGPGVPFAVLMATREDVLAGRFRGGISFADLRAVVEGGEPPEGLMRTDGA